MLFNLAINSVLTRPDGFSGLLPFGRASLKLLSFADDIILAAASIGKVWQMLDLLEVGQVSWELVVAQSKCSAFQITHKNNAWAIVDSKFSL